MTHFIEDLANGDPTIAQTFSRLCAKWDAFFQERGCCELSYLAKELTEFQYHFEEAAGEPAYKAKELMGWTAFAYQRNKTRNEDAILTQAEVLLEAFEKSNCSGEVKVAARQAAWVLFHIEPMSASHDTNAHPIRTSSK